MPDTARLTVPREGIDISDANGAVDVAALKDKVDFIIIRCGYGSNYVDQDDSRYESNVAQCEAAGIPYGVYLYSYAKTAAMARSEAAHALRLLRGKRPLYGVWYDVEDRTLPEGEALIDHCVTWCETLRAAGYYPGIYSSLSWWNGRLKSPRLDRFDRWVAQWSSALTYTGECGMWQYTDRGVIGGKLFDRDRAYRDYPAITEEKEETDMTKEEVAALARREAQAVYRENEEKYPTAASLPRWARKDVERVYEELGLTGTEDRDDGQLRLDASETYVRALVVIARVLEKLEGEGKA